MTKFKKLLNDTITTKFLKKFRNNHWFNNSIKTKEGWENQSITVNNINDVDKDSFVNVFIKFNSQEEMLEEDVVTARLEEVQDELIQHNINDVINLASAQECKNNVVRFMVRGAKS